MKLDQIEKEWKHVARLFREQFGRFTSDDIVLLTGEADQLIAKLQERYGDSREEAERRLLQWSDNLHAPGPRAKRSAAAGSSRHS